MFTPVLTITCVQLHILKKNNPKTDIKNPDIYEIHINTLLGKLTFWGTHPKSK